jgi:alginate O-acetyltransferase complex protein AlgI
MNFTSPIFLVFLPFVLLLYHALRGRQMKYRFLLAASYVFYMTWNPWFVWVLVFATTVDYTVGLLIERAETPAKRRFWLMFSLVSNLGFLAAFKYTSFLVDNGLALSRLFGWETPDWKLRIILPLGISFHTFQGISYTLDVYYGKIKAVRSPLDFALFVAFFPQLVAGPVVRATEFLPQMVDPPTVTGRQVLEGLHGIIIGMFKKIVIADRLAQFVDMVFADPAGFDAATQRWAAVAYAMQVYCDFSGYSDIAIGCAKWFGFELPINFDYPYLADSITDFWCRWHISLSTWIKDYLYIPLGGNRKGTVRTYVNLLVAMTLCGLWHGASWNYVAWGLYNGIFLALHRVFDRMARGIEVVERCRASIVWRMLSLPITFFVVLGGMILVRNQDWSVCWLMERTWIGAAWEGRHYVPGWIPCLIGLVALEHLLHAFAGLRTGWRLLPALPRSLVYAAGIAAIVIFGPRETVAFVYFQF